MLPKYSKNFHSLKYNRNDRKIETILLLFLLFFTPQPNSIKNQLILSLKNSMTCGRTTKWKVSKFFFNFYEQEHVLSLVPNSNILSKNKKIHLNYLFFFVHVHWKVIYI